MPWFRMYVDFLNDPKMIALAFEDQRHFIGILALKSDGIIDAACATELLDRIVAQRLWIDPAVISDVKRRLVAAGLIDTDWQPLAWEKRQYSSDSSTERTRRYRERLRETRPEKASDEGETSRERHGDLLDTDTDTEKTIHAPKGARRSIPKPEGVPESTWADFLAIRKAKRCPLTSTALAGIEREAELAGISLSDALATCCARGWQGFNADWLTKPGVQKSQVADPWAGAI